MSPVFHTELYFLCLIIPDLFPLCSSPVSPRLITFSIYCLSLRLSSVKLPHIVCVFPGVSRCFLVIHSWYNYSWCLLVLLSVFFSSSKSPYVNFHLYCSAFGSPNNYKQSTQLTVTHCCWVNQEVWSIINEYWSYYSSKAHSHTLANSLRHTSVSYLFDWKQDGDGGRVHLED